MRPHHAARETSSRSHHRGRKNNPSWCKLCSTARGMNNQIVLPRHLMPVRTLLDGKGLLEGEEFDQWLDAGSLKQSAS